jgi:RNA polymerase sigma-70 factor, ECF subfamily
VDHLRRNRLRQTVPLEDADDLFAADQTDAAAARLDVEKLLASLPASSQEIIRKVKIDGRSTADVAIETGRSEVAVRVGLHRGLKTLGERLQKGQGRADG